MRLTELEILRRPHLMLTDFGRNVIVLAGGFHRRLQALEHEHPDLVTPDSPTQRVSGEPLSGFDSVRHAVPMLSMDNTYSEDELRAHVRNQIAAFKVPVEIQFQADPLPRNANGKILKPELRDRFQPRG